MPSVEKARREKIDEDDPFGDLGVSTIVCHMDADVKTIVDGAAKDGDYLLGVIS